MVAFDVIGTLFSLEPLGRRLVAAGLHAGALDEWFARFLRDALALDAAGMYTLGLETERYAEQWRGPADRPPGSSWRRDSRRAASAPASSSAE